MKADQRPHTPEFVESEYGAYSSNHDEGDFDGALVTYAQYHQGGDGRWRGYVTVTGKGRKKKIGIGRIAGKAILTEFSGIGYDTQEEAKAWCVKIWSELPKQKGGLDG